MGGRINTVMQTCFFALSGVLPRDEAIARSSTRSENVRQARRGRRAEELRRRGRHAGPSVRGDRPGAVRPAISICARRCLRSAGVRADVLRPTMIAGDGDDLPVSALPVDGTYPSGTAQWEKRNIALEIPVWDENSASSAASACWSARTPSSAPRSTTRQRWPARRRPSRACPRAGKNFRSRRYTLQVSPEDCTGCALCVEVCPVKNKSETRPQGDQHGAAAAAARAGERELGVLPQLPEIDRTQLARRPGQGHAAAAAAVRVLAAPARAAARRPI